MAATYEPIASTTLGSAAASYTFSSIPSTYTDLILVSRAKVVATGVHRALLLRFNGDTGNNYSVTRIYGNGSSAASDRMTNQTDLDIGFLPNEASQFGTSIASIMSYASSSVYKSVLCAWESQGGLSGSQYVTREVGLWRSTSAITSLSVQFYADNIAAGSTFSLYGLAAA